MAFAKMAGFDLINIVRDLDPVAAVRDAEAIERMKAYPILAGAGPADFGCAEQCGAVWRILSLGCMDPAGARYALASHLRETAQERDGDTGAEMLAVAAQLDPEEGEQATANEWVVAGRRYRIIRTQGYARMGDDGPEPVRSTDTDPAGGEPPYRGFVIDPPAPTGPAEATLRMELVNMVPAPGTVPAHIRQETVAALHSHPGVVLLPTEFAIVDEHDGRWLPLSSGRGPRDARQSLAFFFREILPRFGARGYESLTADQLAECAEVADQIETSHGYEFTVLGRRYRVIRVVSMVRVGQDGPEMARLSDEETSTAKGAP